MAAQMRAALTEMMKMPGKAAVAHEDIYAALTNLFSSEKELARFLDSIRDSAAARAYAKWTDHRITTGHTGVEASLSMN